MTKGVRGVLLSNRRNCPASSLMDANNQRQPLSVSSHQ